MGENSVPELTNEFVSKLIGKQVQSFTITPGTAPGDNYMSVLYSLKCVLAASEKFEENIIYAISKCYPAHPVRQQFLNKGNIFWKELSIYKIWIPVLKALPAQYDVEVKLPFVPLISGESVNFLHGEENEEMLKKYEGKVVSPFDIFIMMVDMKNTFGFRMADRTLGLGLEEMNLVMREYAKIHALSCAFKVKNGIEDLSVKFPFLKLNMTEEGIGIYMNMMSSNVQNAYDVLSKFVTPEESGILTGLSSSKEKIKEITESIFLPGEAGLRLEALLRIPPDRTEDQRTVDDVPWQVVVHGDGWLNNLLFRYDPVTNKAVELVLIDLQLMREACPTIDLADAIYSNSTPELREKHLKDWLRLYADQFMSHCDALGVPYLSGFSYKSLVHRFHRSKLVGFMMGLIALPIMLGDAQQVQDLDSCMGDMNMAEMIISTMGRTEDNVTYKERLYALAKEMYDDGVI